MAVRQGVALAKAIDAKVTGITVSPPLRTVTLDTMMVTATAGEHEKDCAARAEQYLAVIRDAAQAARVPYEGVHAIDDYPYQAIIRTAQGKGCDLIFMASHGRKGMSALVLGSRDYEGPHAHQDPGVGLPLKLVTGREFDVQLND